MNEDQPIIKSNDMVIVTQMGNITEIQHMEKMNRQARIKKLNKKQYLDLETGEIKNFNQSENRSENVNSLRQTMKKMRYLINNNFSGKKNELALTLTYKENITDTKQLMRDLQNFIDKLRYRFKDRSKIEFIHVIEPQERGAWHSHTLLRFEDLEYIYIPNKEIADIWGHGFVTVKGLKDVDNIGAYLSAYLTDLPLKDDEVASAMINGKKLIEKEINGEMKRFIKGGRLHLYPPGMRFFRKSKGIKYPERKNMKYGKAKKELGLTEPQFSSVLNIENDEFQNTVSFEEYNSNR